VHTECATSSQVLFKFVLRPPFLPLYGRTTWHVCTRRKLPRRQSDFSARLYHENLSWRSNGRAREWDERTLLFHYIITSPRTSVATLEISGMLWFSFAHCVPRDFFPCVAIIRRRLRSYLRLRLLWKTHAARWSFTVTAWLSSSSAVILAATSVNR